MPDAKDKNSTVVPNDVVRRNDQFTGKMATKIWREVPSKSNPYIAESASCHGYDLIELCNKRSFVDVLYLMFKGDLPTAKEASIFEKLMIAFISPGPRHPAVRAAMNAGIGKTDSSHILPIGLTVLGGSHLGGAEVESSMRWLRRNSRRDPEALAVEMLNDDSAKPIDDKLAPGFGKRFGGVDLLATKISKYFVAEESTGKVFNWASIYSKKVNEREFGWLSTGVIAAVLCDLGFQPRTGPGIYQILSAPGVFAHGIEMSNKPLTAMPFIDDEFYSIELESERNSE